MRRMAGATLTIGIFICFGVSVAGVRASHEAVLKSLVEADWARQEARRAREPGDPQAVHEALQRIDRLLAALGTRLPQDVVRSAEDELRPLRERAAGLDSLPAGARLELYQQIRWLARRLALRNPLVAGKPLVFLKRRRFACQMLHEYLGYFCDYGDVEGGGVFLLKEPGRSLEVADLIGGRLARGNYTTLALSYDARTIYFAFCPRADQKPDYYSADRRCFHVYAVDADGGKLRQLTHGPDDDFDPCPLPDGRLAFMSTRRGGFTRCNNPWEPIPVYTLQRMDAGGGNIRALSLHETNEWHPSVLGDGRIVYIRWDYVDRSAANFHGLWVTGPDGTNPSILFGNYTKRINACYQPRAIPGSHKIAFVAGAHHAVVGGSLVILDPARARLDPHSGEDRLEAVEVLTPGICFPEAPGWPDSYVHSPWPLSEDFFLIAFSHEPLPGMGPGVRQDTPTGLYYFDRFGNLELLYSEPGISCMYPVPLGPRPDPPVLPSNCDPELGDEAELFLADVQKSLFPLPESRRVTHLRVFQVLPKTATHIHNTPRIGHANAESARMMLGTVPVEADGSAYFRVPARKPIYFQAVDGAGRAVQTMRSVTYLQRGERRGCVGCHEPVGTAPRVRKTLALGRPPSELRPGPDGTRPFSFARLVQPVLDRHCVRCHDGSDGPGKSTLIFTGEPSGAFTKAYESLKPFVRWYEWGGATIRPIVTRPGHCGADESPLLAVLEDETHEPEVHLDAPDRQRLLIWLDGNVPFYGTYSEAEQQAQRSGAAVPPPGVQ